MAIITTELKRRINELTAMLNSRIDQINELDAKADVSFERIEELESELAKLISFIDKVAAGFDYPREYILAIVDKAKFIYQKGE